MQKNIQSTTFYSYHELNKIYIFPLLLNIKAVIVVHLFLLLYISGKLNIL